MSEIEKSIVQIYSDHVINSYVYPWGGKRKYQSYGSGFCLEILEDKNKHKSKGGGDPSNKDNKETIDINLSNPGNPGNKIDNGEINKEEIDKEINGSEDINELDENTMYKKSKAEKKKISKKYILTNAHCVDNSTYITAKKRGSSEWFRMKIEIIICECDLAVLSPQDDAFWDGVQPLSLGEMPKKLDKVLVYGYPLGGYNISVTKGIVNRVQIIPYFNVVNGIAIQIDAPINFGNSGGPVIDRNGEVVGVAFAGEDDKISQNMGYIIPTTFINFIFDIFRSEKVFRGICTLGTEIQTLNNVGLREYYKTDKGILVTKVYQLGSSYKFLKENDVITKIDGIDIRSDGTVPLEKIVGYSINDEIVPYTNITSLKRPGTIVPVEIIRDGKVLKVDIKLQPENFLIPILEYQINPSYYIIAGLVFIPLSYMFIDEKRKDRESISSIIGTLQREPKTHGEQIIILSQIIRTELTEDFVENNDVLTSLNDQEIINLSHLFNLVQKEMKKADYLVFKFDRKEIILSTADVKKHHKSILEQNIGKEPEYLN
jgi:S1-C subfamily serine protease